MPEPNATSTFAAAGTVSDDAATAMPQPAATADRPAAAPPPRPAATPPAAQPVARVHWVGTYAEHRHPADLYPEIVAGAPDLVVIDARYRETFAREHLPGARSIPWREIDATTTADWRRDARYVVYCWSETCHASAKAAARIASLGFDVKELHGGLQAWKRQGFPTERG